VALPPCPARRFFEGTQEVFFCAHPQMTATDQMVHEGVCQVCLLWGQPPPAEFRRFTPGPPPPPRGPCQDLGELIEVRACPSCTGRVQVKVFACGHPAHRETTLRNCAHCPDHRPRVGAEAARPGGHLSAAGGAG
jgi:hypothetical protein